MKGAVFFETPPGGGSFARGRRWLGRYSPLRGCSDLAALATAKIPRRSTLPGFQAGSGLFLTKEAMKSRTEKTWSRRFAAKRQARAPGFSPNRGQTGDIKNNDTFLKLLGRFPPLKPRISPVMPLPWNGRTAGVHSDFKLETCPGGREDAAAQ